jgi:hypothetical protein
VVETTAQPGPQGRRFERVGEIIEAVVAATVYWNHHRHPDVWKKAI